MVLVYGRFSIKTRKVEFAKNDSKACYDASVVLHEMVCGVGF